MKAWGAHCSRIVVIRLFYLVRKYIVDCNANDRMLSNYLLFWQDMFVRDAAAPVRSPRTHLFGLGASPWNGWGSSLPMMPSILLTTYSPTASACAALSTPSLSNATEETVLSFLSREDTIAGLMSQSFFVAFPLVSIHACMFVRIAVHGCICKQLT